MKSFAERDPLIICAVGVALSLAIVIGALNYQSLPFFNRSDDYSAYFADASGLVPGSPVEVSGTKAGQVESVSLDGPRVLVDFTVADRIQLGDRTEVAIKTRTLLGSKILEVTPRGGGTVSSPIPIERTTSGYQLPDALGDLTTAISGLDTGQLSDSLATLSTTFKDTPPELSAAVDAVGRFSTTINRRDEQLRHLLADANKVTGVLAERADQVVGLIRNGSQLLGELRSQSAALDEISQNITTLATQVKGFIADNRDTLKPALEKLNGALAIIDNRKTEVQEALKRLNGFALALGETVAGGPYFQAYIGNLLPGQFVQPFIDAAFSDLGVDPNTLPPTRIADPPVGQPGTPPLPMPYPRTGQAGDPRLTLPDAISGNAADQPCGPESVPLPGPGCYPARESQPAPPPGGAPPGPPAEAPPDLGSTPQPTPSPVLHPAPAEPAPPVASPPIADARPN
ncbi:MCE family protein, partial [Mycobacterium sp. NPDC003449]